MKRILFGTSGVVVLLCAVLVARAEKTDAPTTQPVNKMCPVMTDEEINPGVTFEYEGKTYAFCCKKCIGIFKKDPAKYAAQAK